jgi:hypothetical protein
LQQSVTVHHESKQAVCASMGESKPHSGYVKGEHNGGICPLKQ